MRKSIPIKIRDIRKKEFFVVDDEYLNGFAKHFDSTTSLVYICLCRHVDKDQIAFPSHTYMAKKLGISRRTVSKKVKILEENNLIKRKKIRRKNGRWLNTTYTLLDKSQWKKPWEKSSHGKAMGNKRHSHGKNFPTKDTHKKDTHILVGVPTNKKEFGNPQINETISYFKKTMKLPALDDSIKKNRQYAHLLLKKFNGIDGVKKLIDYASEDDFWQNKLTSLVKLYYKGVQIISKRRDNGKKAAIDATQYIND